MEVYVVLDTERTDLGYIVRDVTTTLDDAHKKEAEINAFSGTDSSGYISVEGPFSVPLPTLRAFNIVDHRTTPEDENVDVVFTPRIPSVPDRTLHNTTVAKAILHSYKFDEYVTIHLHDSGSIVQCL